MAPQALPPAHRLITGREQWLPDHLHQSPALKSVPSPTRHTSMNDIGSNNNVAGADELAFDLQHNKRERRGERNGCERVRKG
uniref:Uncharacterized protein n=1 Tax=Leersia perrieri TaxID=77586 RepID=A0A0D9Y139_9ORYZ